jgi:hypothetical protein
MGVETKTEKRPVKAPRPSIRVIMISSENSPYWLSEKLERL